MYIVTKDRKSVVNVDRFNEITVFENDIHGYIMAKTYDSRIILGEYAPERARGVFEELLTQAFPPNLLIVETFHTDEIADIDSLKQLGAVVAKTDDIPRIDMIEPKVYYMPKE